MSLIDDARDDPMMLHLRDAHEIAAALLAAEELAILLEQVQRQGCEVCTGDCSSANPPISLCPVRERMEALAAYREATR